MMREAGLTKFQSFETWQNDSKEKKQNLEAWQIWI